MKTKSHIFKNLLLATSALIIALVVLHGIQKESQALPPKEVSLSVAKTYSNLKDLKKDSDLVALVTVGDAKPSQRLGSDLPTTDLTLTIDKVFSGNYAQGQNVTLVQMVDLDGHVQYTDSVPLLDKGSKYVVFLSKQWPDQPQLFLTGADGAFKAKGNGKAFGRAGKIQNELPTEVSVDEVSNLN